MTSSRTKNPNYRYATKAGLCRRCGQPIIVGQKIALGSREFAHPSCARLHVTQSPAAARFITGSNVGKACVGCSYLITADEESLTVMAVPWHRECRVRDQAMRL